MGRKNKQSMASNLDPEVERDFIRLMPELPRMFATLAVNIEKFDGAQPRSFLDQIERDLKPLGENIKSREHQFQRFFGRLFGRFTARLLVRKFALTFIKIAKTSAAADNRYSLLLKLMHEIDQQIPFVSLMVASEYVKAQAPGYLDAKAFFVAQSTAMNFYKRAEQASGEERATFALIAHAKTVDLLYKPYLIALWFFSYIKVGKWPPAHIPELGTMMAVIIDRLPEYHGLVERDAIWMRNSAVHNEPEYEGDHSVWMWDRKHPQKKVKVNELMSLTESLFVISTHTIQSVSQLYFLRDFILNTGLLDMAADCIAHEAGGDREKLKNSESMAKVHAESLLKPVMAFVNGIQSVHRGAVRTAKR
jgi:hypothetical protein